MDKPKALQAHFLHDGEGEGRMGESSTGPTFGDKWMCEQWAIILTYSFYLGENHIRISFSFISLHQNTVSTKHQMADLFGPTVPSYVSSQNRSLQRSLHGQWYFYIKTAVRSDSFRKVAYMV